MRVAVVISSFAVLLASASTNAPTDKAKVCGSKLHKLIKTLECLDIPEDKEISSYFCDPSATLQRFMDACNFDSADVARAFVDHPMKLNRDEADVAPTTTPRARRALHHVPKHHYKRVLIDEWVDEDGNGEDSLATANAYKTHPKNVGKRPISEDYEFPGLE